MLLLLLLLPYFIHFNNLWPKIEVEENKVAGAVTYRMDQENEVCQMFIISLGN